MSIRTIADEHVLADLVAVAVAVARPLVDRTAVDPACDQVDTPLVVGVVDLEQIERSGAVDPAVRYNVYLRATQR